MSQLESIGRMIKARRDEEITEAANKAALSILENLEPDFDPREVAQQISDALEKVLNESR